MELSIQPAAGHRNEAVSNPGETVRLPEVDILGWSMPGLEELDSPPARHEIVELRLVVLEVLVVEVVAPGLQRRLLLGREVLAGRQKLLGIGEEAQLGNRLPAVVVQGEAAELRLDVRRLDPHPVLLVQMAPPGGFQKAGRRAGEGGQALQGDSGAGERAGPGVFVRRHAPLEIGQDPAQLRQLGPDLDRHPMGREERVQVPCPGHVGHLDPRRPGPPLPAAPGNGALQQRGDLLPRTRIRSHDRSGIQVQTEDDPGPERISSIAGEPGRQADGAHLPRLERLALKGREDPPAGLRHPLSFPSLQRFPGAGTRHGAICYGMTERFGEMGWRKGRPVQKGDPAERLRTRTEGRRTGTEKLRTRTERRRQEIDRPPPRRHSQPRAGGRGRRGLPPPTRVSRQRGG